MKIRRRVVLFGPSLLIFSIKLLELAQYRMSVAEVSTGQPLHLSG